MDDEWGGRMEGGKDGRMEEGRMEEGRMEEGRMEEGRMEASGIGVLSYRRERERLWSGIRGLSEPRITQDFADYADKSKIENRHDFYK